mgnify:CR=1 FL=1
MRTLMLAASLLLGTIPSLGQGYVDQDRVAPLLNSQYGSIDNVQKVEWAVYDYQPHKKGSKIGPWTKLKSYLDSLPGAHHGYRLEIVELANRVTSDKLKPPRKLLVPKSFNEDYRAYSPYPFFYPEAANLPKLFIIDKFTQTFGAYENGNLVRWGIVSAGRTNDLTPTGKFNFTWKDEFRLSSAAPPGEVWEMPYMFNFEPKSGIHLHQYSLPIATPASHGCVRVAMADAMWNYNWADGTGDNGKTKGTPVWVINDNPKGRSAHWTIDADGNVQSLVRLPGNTGSDTYATK